MNDRLYRLMPRITIIVVLLALMWTIFNIKLYRQDKKVIYWDVLEYYSYLPATFIYHDLSLKFTEKDPAQWSDKFWPLTAPNGGKVIKMSMGMAFLYSPFFFTAHIMAPLLGYKANGFTPPYKLALELSSIFYLALGLYFLSRILRLYFNPLITSLAILGVTAGTNLFYYASLEAPMSHTYSFSLFAVFIWLTIRWHNRPSLSISVFIGLLSGLITLIRPSNITVILIFILYGITNKDTAVQQFTKFTKEYRKLIIIAAAAALIWLPQLFYWKYNTGEWLYYSYGKEKFFFNNPQFLNGLFSYRKGWLLYTPIMTFSLAGIFFTYKHLKQWFLPLVPFTIINFYIIVSWWSWWYGGSFGLRPMIDSYAFMALPMAVVLNKILKLKIRAKAAGIVIFVMLIFHSLFETAQYYYGAIHWDSMSKNAYWDSFGHIRPPAGFYSKIVSPDYQEALKGKRD